MSDPMHSEATKSSRSGKVTKADSPVQVGPGLQTQFAVFDYTTNNLLGEYDTRAEAEEVIEKVKPLGRYGPDGHDLRIIPLDAEGRVVDD